MPVPLATWDIPAIKSSQPCKSKKLELEPGLELTLHLHSVLCTIVISTPIAIPVHYCNTAPAIRMHSLLNTAPTQRYHTARLSPSCTGCTLSSPNADSLPAGCVMTPPRLGNNPSGESPKHPDRRSCMQANSTVSMTTNTAASGQFCLHAGTAIPQLVACLCDTCDTWAAALLTCTTTAVGVPTATSLQQKGCPAHKPSPPPLLLAQCTTSTLLHVVSAPLLHVCMAQCVLSGWLGAVERHRFGVWCWLMAQQAIMAWSVNLHSTAVLCCLWCLLYGCCWSSSRGAAAAVSGFAGPWWFQAGQFTFTWRGSHLHTPSAGLDLQ